MDFFGWLGSKRKSAEQVVKEPEPVATLYKPPVVMSIVKWDQIGEETPTQFLQYGWRRGEENEYTRPWDNQLKRAYPLLPGCKIHSMSVLLPNGLGLKAASLISPKIDSMNLPTHLILYISADVDFKEMPVIDAVTGGPTPELSDALRYIALRMESRITSVFTDVFTGQVLVTFRSWALNYSIYNNEKRWTSDDLTDTTIKKESDQT